MCLLCFIFRFVGSLKHIQIINNYVLEAHGYVDRVRGCRFSLSPLGRKLSMISQWFDENSIIWDEGYEETPDAISITNKLFMVFVPNMFGLL